MDLAVYDGKRILIAYGTFPVLEAVDAIEVLELVPLVRLMGGILAVPRYLVHELFNGIVDCIGILGFKALFVNHTRVDICDEEGILMCSIGILREIDEVSL